MYFKKSSLKEITNMKFFDERAAKIKHVLQSTYCKKDELQEMSNSRSM